MKCTKPKGIGENIVAAEFSSWMRYMLNMLMVGLVVFEVLCADNVCAQERLLSSRSSKQQLQQLQRPIVPVVSFAELEQMIAPAVRDTVKIINFWATWCKPCVEELPAFQRIAAEFAARNVEVLFVSLDAKRDVERLVVPFVRKRKMVENARVVLLDGGNPNLWIDRIDTTWSGAIPATLVVPASSQRLHGESTVSRIFREQQFSYEQLKALIDEVRHSSLH
jgi:thiol-disulfide isomerase/thioredoxin